MPVPRVCSVERSPASTRLGSDADGGVRGRGVRAGARYEWTAACPRNILWRRADNVPDRRDAGTGARPRRPITGVPLRLRRSITLRFPWTRVRGARTIPSERLPARRSRADDRDPRREVPRARTGHPERAVDIDLLGTRLAPIDGSVRVVGAPHRRADPAVVGSAGATTALIRGAEALVPSSCGAGEPATRGEGEAPSGARTYRCLPPGAATGAAGSTSETALSGWMPGKSTSSNSTT